MMASATDDLLGEWDLRDHPLPSQCVDQLSAILDKEDSSGLNWQTFASYLGFPESLTDEIRQLSLGGLSPTKCVLELYENAVSWPTWRDFHVALRKMDLTEAEAILIQHSSSERYSNYSQDEIGQFTTKWKNPLNLGRALKTDNLSGECVKAVSAKLNRPNILGRDWKGLARALGFDDDVIQIIRNERNQTQTVLSLHQANDNATLGKLYNALRKINRIDVIYTLWIYYEIILVTDSGSESRHDKAPQLLDKWDLRDYPLPENCISELVSHLDVEHKSGLNWRMFTFYLGFGESGIEAIDELSQLHGLSPTKIVLEMYAHVMPFPTWQSIHSAIQQIDQPEAESKLIEFGTSRRRRRYSEAEVIHFQRSLKNPSNLERKLKEIRLSDKCVEAVSIVLNNESDLFELNWKVLAKKLGFDNEVIAMISDHDANKRTQMLLDMYQAGDNATLGKLYSAIENIHRTDVKYLLWKYNELVLTKDSDESLTGDGNTSDTTTSPEEKAADTRIKSSEDDCGASANSAKSVKDDESFFTLLKKIYEEAKEVVKEIAGAVKETLANVETVEIHMKDSPDVRGKREKRSRSDSSGSIIHHQYNIHGGNVIIGDHGKIGDTSFLDDDAKENMTCDENGAESNTSSAEETAVDREQVLRNMGFEKSAICNALDTFPEDPVHVIATYLAMTHSGHRTGDNLLSESSSVSSVESGSKKQLECPDIHQTSPSADVSNAMVDNLDAEVQDTIQGETLAVSRGSSSYKDSGDIVQDQGGYHTGEINKDVKSEEETVIDKKRLLQDMGFEENSVDEALFLFPEDEVRLIATYLSEIQAGENTTNIPRDKDRCEAEQTKLQQGPTVQETPTSAVANIVEQREIFAQEKECHHEGKDDVFSRPRHSRLQTETSSNEKMLALSTDISLPSTQQAYPFAGRNGRADENGNVTTGKEQVLVAPWFEKNSVRRASEKLPQKIGEQGEMKTADDDDVCIHDDSDNGDHVTDDKETSADSCRERTVEGFSDSVGIGYADNACTGVICHDNSSDGIVDQGSDGICTVHGSGVYGAVDDKIIGKDTVYDISGGDGTVDNDNGSIVAVDGDSSGDVNTDDVSGGVGTVCGGSGGGGDASKDGSVGYGVVDYGSSGGDGAVDDGSSGKGTVDDISYGDGRIDDNNGGIATAGGDSSGDVVSGGVGTVCGGSGGGGDASKDGSVGYGVVDYGSSGGDGAVDDGSSGKGTVDDISYGDGRIDDNNGGIATAGGDSSGDVNTDDVSDDIDTVCGGVISGGCAFNDGCGDGGGGNDSCEGNGTVDDVSDCDGRVGDDNSDILVGGGDSSGDVNTYDVSDDGGTVAGGNGGDGAFNDESSVDGTINDGIGGDCAVALGSGGNRNQTT